MTSDHLQTLRLAGVWPEGLLYEEGEANYGAFQNLARSALIVRMLEELPYGVGVFRLQDADTDETVYWIEDDDDNYSISNPDLFLALYLALESSGRLTRKEPS